MMNLSFVQGFSLVALDTEDSKNMSNSKRMALRSICSATILELYFTDQYPVEGGTLTLSKDDLSNMPAYTALVVDAILNKQASLTYPLGEWLKLASTIPSKIKASVEELLTSSLIEASLMDHVPNLLGCDINYSGASISLWVYRAHQDAYMRQIERVRAEVLEVDALTDESIAYLWLLRECGQMTYFFSKKELEEVLIHLSNIYHTNSFARGLLSTYIHKSLETAYKSFLTTKKNLMKTPLGTGIAFIFPALERSESIFVETEAWFSNNTQRLTDLEKKLTEHGHQYTVMRTGEAPLLKIDNVLYEGLPQSICPTGIPIQGIRLRRYPLELY